MNLGYFGIIVAYLIIVSVCLYIIIQLKGRWFLKAVCILAFIYYSVGIGYSINSFMGWPTSSDIPSGSRVIWVQIQEPDWIYFWVQVDFRREDLFKLNPSQVFQYVGRGEPRIFRIPYSKEEHQKILEAMKKKAGQVGSQVKIEWGEGQEAEQGKDRSVEGTDNMRYKIINPFELMPKQQ